jgi:hypothetical protein
MKIRLKTIIPSLQEAIVASVVSIIILFLTNSKQLLSYYGLQSSNEVIKSSAGNVLSDALKTLDSFSATNGIVTFLIWAVVGTVCFAIVESLGGAYHEFRLERQVSSNKYVHPLNFSGSKFWRGVILNAISLFFGLALLAASTLLFMILVLPIGLAYARNFLFDVTVVNAVYLVLGLLVMTVGLLVIDIAIRFLLNRGRLVRAA